MSSINAKKALKNLVKECLLEILSEGLNSETKNFTMIKKNPITTSSKTISSMHKTSIKQNDIIDEMVYAITSDYVMKSIFADTAKNTLVEQMQHESRNAMSNLDSSVGSGINIDSMFSEASNSWSEMAFGNRKNNG